MAYNSLISATPPMSIFRIFFVPAPFRWAGSAMGFGDVTSFLQESHSSALLHHPNQINRNEINHPETESYWMIYGAYPFVGLGAKKPFTFNQWM